ncbi:hypothetical protein BDN72DRAFT_101602 [Pluteus cervinus]|uniref:Uncharacterized protein n=1 Tax=Pluteus cervinus TaxID=181527 RepID=A0ACD3B8F9_9AGAR|nr:hypothetical protein BDN72DRAFT_101602 [Pluteus cervinus]
MTTMVPFISISTKPIFSRFLVSLGLSELTYLQFIVVRVPSIAHAFSFFPRLLVLLCIHPIVHISVHSFALIFSPHILYFFPPHRYRLLPSSTVRIGVRVLYLCSVLCTHIISNPSSCTYPHTSPSCLASCIPQ